MRRESFLAFLIFSISFLFFFRLWKACKQNKTKQKIWNRLPRCHQSDLESDVWCVSSPLSIIHSFLISFALIRSISWGWLRLTINAKDLVNIFEVFLPQLLLYPNPTDPLNGDAASMLLKDPASYANKVRGQSKRNILLSFIHSFTLFATSF